MEINLTDEQIKKYINTTLAEQEIQNLENEIIRIMKLRQETYPCEKNDSEWFNYTNFFCQRRCQRINEEL